jgi:hypothetical protein
MKIFLSIYIDVKSTLVERIHKTLPTVVVESNYEQVVGIVKEGDLERLCVWMDAWMIRGQGVAERVHLINPVIPILIWDGREYDCPDKDASPNFKVYGKALPIKNDNEIYLSFDDKYSQEDQIKIMKKFFEGTLTAQDIPHRECLDMSRLNF